MEQNLELQYLIDDLMKKVRSIQQKFNLDNGGEEEYLNDQYEILYDELNSAHSTILKIGLEERKLIKK